MPKWGGMHHPRFVSPSPWLSTGFAPRPGTGAGFPAPVLRSPPGLPVSPRHFHGPCLNYRKALPHLLTRRQGRKHRRSPLHPSLPLLLLSLQKLPRLWGCDAGQDSGGELRPPCAGHPAGHLDPHQPWYSPSTAPVWSGTCCPTVPWKAAFSVQPAQEPGCDACVHVCARVCMSLHTYVHAHPTQEPTAMRPNSVLCPAPA